MDDTNRDKQQETADREHMLKKVAEAAAITLTPIETYSIGVLLSMAFGTGTLPSQIFGQHVNAIRAKIGLPRITEAAAGNPTRMEKMLILQSALEKLGDEAQALLFQVLLRSPMHGFSVAERPQSPNKTLRDS